MHRRLLVVCLALAAAGVPSAVFAQATPAQPATPQPAGVMSAPEDAPETVAIRLANHTILVGTIVSENDDEIVLDAGPLGTITIKTAEVLGRLDPAIVAAVGAPPAPPASAPENGVSFFAPPGQVRWVKTLDLQGTFNSAVFEQGPVIGVPATGASLGLAGDQYTVLTQLNLMRATHQHLGYLNASFQKAVYEPQGAVSHMPKISLGYSYRREDNDRYFYTVVYEWYEDHVRRINYSHQAFFGVGYHIVQKPKLKIDIVPLIGVLQEDKGTEFDGELLEGGGALWEMIYQPNPMIQVEHRENFHAAFNEWTYRGLETYVGFKGMLGPKFGLTFGLTHTYDKALESAFLEDPRLAPGVRVFANKPSFVKLTSGLHISF